MLEFVYRKPLSEPYSYFEIKGQTVFDDFDKKLKTIKEVIDTAFPAPAPKEPEKWGKVSDMKSWDSGRVNPADKGAKSQW